MQSKTQSWMSTLYRPNLDPRSVRLSKEASSRTDCRDLMKSPMPSLQPPVMAREGPNLAQGNRWALQIQATRSHHLHHCKTSTNSIPDSLEWLQSHLNLQRLTTFHQGSASPTTESSWLDFNPSTLTRPLRGKRWIAACLMKAMQLRLHWTTGITITSNKPREKTALWTTHLCTLNTVRQLQTMEATS